MATSAYALAGLVQRRWAMRAVLCLALLTACDASCPETKIPASGPIRRGVFVEDGENLRVASAGGGNVVREDCDAQLRLLGPDLMTERTIDLDYEHSRERSVLALARGTGGGIAAVAWDFDYAGDDERSRLRLVHIAPAGNVVWTRLLAQDQVVAPAVRVAIGWNQVFVIEHDFKLTALSRATGDVAWEQIISDSSAQRSDLAVLDNGDVVVAGPGVRGVASYSPTGELRWKRAPDAFGMTSVGNIAVATDGSLAVRGDAGPIQRIALVAPDGTLAWSHDIGRSFADRVSSMVTDGARIVVAGDFTGQLSFDPSTRNDDNTDGFIASISANGVDAVQVAGGVGTQRADVVTLYGSTSAIVRVRNFETDPAPEIRIGAVTIEGAGMALVDYEHL